MLLINMVRLVLASEAGQDLIEYALMAGFIAVGAAAVMPSIATSIGTVFSKVGSVVTVAGS